MVLLAGVVEFLHDALNIMSRKQLLQRSLGAEKAIRIPGSHMSDQASLVLFASLQEVLILLGFNLQIIGLTFNEINHTLSNLFTSSGVILDGVPEPNICNPYLEHWQKKYFYYYKKLIASNGSDSENNIAYSSPPVFAVKQPPHSKNCAAVVFRLLFPTLAASLYCMLASFTLTQTMPSSVSAANTEKPSGTLPLFQLHGKTQMLGAVVPIGTGLNLLYHHLSSFFAHSLGRHFHRSHGSLEHGADFMSC